MLRNASYPGYLRMCVIRGGYFKEEKEMTDNYGFIADEYFLGGLTNSSFWDKLINNV